MGQDNLTISSAEVRVAGAHVHCRDDASGAILIGTESETKLPRVPD